PLARLLDDCLAERPEERPSFRDVLAGLGPEAPIVLAVAEEEPDPVRLREVLFSAATEHPRVEGWGGRPVAEGLLPRLGLGAAGVCTIVGIVLLATRTTPVVMPIGLAGVAVALAVLLSLVRKRLRRIAHAAETMFEVRDEVLRQVPEARAALGWLLHTRTEL